MKAKSIQNRFVKALLVIISMLLVAARLYFELPPQIMIESKHQVIAYIDGDQIEMQQCQEAFCHQPKMNQKLKIEVIKSNEQEVFIHVYTQS